MSDLRALIEAAKADGPGAAARAKVWTGVSSAVGGAAAMSGTGAGAGAGAAAGSMGAVKMLLLGTLLGGTLTVGIGATMLFVRGAPPATIASGVAAPAPATAPPPPETRFVMAAPMLPSPATVILGSTVNPMPIPAAPPIAPVAPPPPAEATRRPIVLRTYAAASIPTSPPAPPARDPDDALAREAALLASARNALARRDALTALQIVRGLTVLPGRQLVPEEMAVEAQALRGLGLAEQAQAVDSTLRTRFPDSVLGR